MGSKEEYGGAMGFLGAIGRDLRLWGFFGVFGGSRGFLMFLGFVVGYSRLGNAMVLLGLAQRVRSASH